MKITVFLSCFLILESIVCLAQQQNPRRRSEDAATRSSKEADASFRSLREIEIPNLLNSSAKDISNPQVQSLYRKPTKDELKMFSVSPIISEKYKEFLQSENSGIIKLNGQSECFVNSQVINAIENCSAYTMPGLGMAFSFRMKNYRIHHLADLILDGKVIKTDSLFQQGIMVNLGDIDLTTIDKKTDSIKTLMNFPTANNKQEFDKFNDEIMKGIKKDNYIYRIGFFSTPNTTFALRSIAYKGKMIRTVDGVTYNELDFDKRKDVVVVFRIVEKNEKGDITIIWKELSERDSPALKIE
ncbi:MAG: hypothetical protein MUC29_10080 [Pyrinomonadaceae bacterium]|nr:hypothetical protein [Pyrinomonadaceae bacterium]